MGVICSEDGAAVVSERQDSAAPRDSDLSTRRDVGKSRGGEDLHAAASTADVVNGRDIVMASTSGGKAAETGSLRREGTVPMLNGNEDPNVASDEESLVTDSSSDDADLPGGQDLPRAVGHSDPSPGPTTGSQETTAAVVNASKDSVANSSQQEPATSDPSPDSLVASHDLASSSSTRQDLPDSDTSHALTTTSTTTTTTTTTAVNTNQDPATAKVVQVRTWTEWDSGDDDDYDDDEDEEPEHDHTEEEEEEVVWLTQVEDREAYLRVMTPQYLCLALRSATPLQETQVKMAVVQLCRRWPWLKLRLRLREEETQRTPWLTILPRQPLHLQTADDDNKWSIMESVQGRHRCLRGGPLCSFTLLRETSDTSSSSASDVTTDSTSAASGNSGAVSAHANNATGSDKVDDSSVSDSKVTPSSNAKCSAEPSSTSGGSSAPSPVAAGSLDAPGGGSSNSSAFRHKCQLLLGVPKPFVDEASSAVICDTFVKALDGVLAEGTSASVQESPETQESTGNQRGDFDEQIHLMQNLRSYTPVSYDNTDILAGGYNGEENEMEENGYVRRNIEQLVSRNFFNKCKAERVTYISGFTTCVSAAVMNLLVEAGSHPKGSVIDVSHRVFVHYRWPEPAYEWQDNEGDEDSDSESTPPRPGITITASPDDWCAKFWTTVRTVHRKQWELRRAKRKSIAAQKIPYSLDAEDDGEERHFPPSRYPDVNLSLSHVSLRDPDDFTRCGDRLEATSLHTLSPLRHFLLTLNINLQVQEEVQKVCFYLNHSTLFVPAATGRRFADEIESVMESCLKYR